MYRTCRNSNSWRLNYSIRFLVAIFLIPRRLWYSTYCKSGSIIRTKLHIDQMLSIYVRVSCFFNEWFISFFLKPSKKCFVLPCLKKKKNGQEIFLFVFKNYRNQVLFNCRICLYSLKKIKSKLNFSFRNHVSSKMNLYLLGFNVWAQNKTLLFVMVKLLKDNKKFPLQMFLFFVRLDRKELRICFQMFAALSIRNILLFYAINL